jgi:multidrug efflux pump subunit AcrA (membrane-fusion protein)
LNPKTRRLLLVFALIILFAIAAVVPMKQTVSGPCRVESAVTWYLARNGAGQVTSGWERNLLQIQGGNLMLQFERPDYVEVILAKGIRQGGMVQAGDTVAWVESREGTGRLQALEAELDRAKSQLAGLITGARTVDVRVAEHDFERASAALQVAQIDFQRIQALYDSGYTTLSDLQQTEGTLEEKQAEADHARVTIMAMKEGARPEDIHAGEAEVARLESAVETARHLLGKREVIITPVSGVVDVNEGLNGALIRVARVDTLAVITRLPEASLPLISDKLPLEMLLDADPEGPRAVSIVDYGFSSTEIPAAFAIGLVPNSTGTLRAGMSGSATCSMGDRTLLEGAQAKLGILGF